jgi:BolA protein
MRWKQMLSRIDSDELRVERMGAVSEAIRRKLAAAFFPLRLEVEDDSARHHGHAGATPGGESHFNVVIEAATFEGLGRVQRQRAVYAVLKDELAGPVHALSVTALAPGEAA